jgi:hypothetical protein
MSSAWFGGDDETAVAVFQAHRSLAHRVAREVHIEWAQLHEGTLP